MADQDFEEELHYRTVRRTYLLTYSQADLSKFLTRELFADAVIASFENEVTSRKSKAVIQKWVCGKELHPVTGGHHYQMAIKLSSQKRWKSAKNYLLSKYGASVHFSSHHDDYHSAYKYAAKEVKELIHSPLHPKLEAIRSPRTQACTKAYRQRSRSKREADRQGKEEGDLKKKHRRLSNLEVSDFLIKNNIKRDIQLFALANERKSEGDSELAEFVLGRSEKSLKELISNSWKLKTASSTLTRETKSRMELLRIYENGECVDHCEGQWIECAKEVLKLNKGHPYLFAAVVRELMEKGSGKFRNIIIVGPANCGKTFVLSPLTKIYKTFSNPATTSYAWLGVEDCEVIFLNDFRWSSEVIAWKELLLLLEGQPLHFPAPKTTYAQDICLERDTPVFATSKETIKFIGKYNQPDEKETEMMAARWKVFNFSHQIPEAEQKQLPACGHCFAKLVMLGVDME
eukprot:gene1981-biopygen1803